MDTLGHAGLSMLVTSLTTAAAFFSSFVCPVTAIRCFSLFAGLTVTIHFMFMLSWLPASVLLAEKYFSPVCHQNRRPLPFMNPLRKCWRATSDLGRITFDKILPCVVVKLRYFWIVVLGGSAIAAAVVVFHYPKLKLPDTREFQLFSSSHPFERYNKLSTTLRIQILKIKLNFVGTIWSLRTSSGLNGHSVPSCWPSCLYGSSGASWTKTTVISWILLPKVLSSSIHRSTWPHRNRKFGCRNSARIFETSRFSSRLWVRYYLIALSKLSSRGWIDVVRYLIYSLVLFKNLLFFCCDDKPSSDG